MTTNMSQSDRESLILEHFPQVRALARNFRRHLPERINVDDLISSGTVGLIKAIDSFDPAANVKLSTYAEYRIRGAMIDFLRSTDWAPRQRRKMSRQIQAATSSAEQRLGRVPTEEDIAVELGLSLAKYHQWLVDTIGLQIVSLERQATTFGEPPSNAERHLAMPESESPESLLGRVELERVIAAAINQLTDQERAILRMYYYKELKLPKIAQLLGLHVSRISQVKKQALLGLRLAIRDGRQTSARGSGARRLDTQPEGAFGDGTSFKRVSCPSCEVQVEVA